MATKAELELKLKAVRRAYDNATKDKEACIKEFEDFKKDINKSLIIILQNNCSEAIEPIQLFCEDLEIEFPRKKVKITFEMDYGDSISYIVTENSKEIYDFDEIILDK